MPWEGLNPLEFGAGILVEAAQKYNQGEGFKEHSFLGAGTRTASWAQLDTPSDCAVPERFSFRFDRRLTAGEDPHEAAEHIEALSSVKKAREAGLDVKVEIPVYEDPTWKGYVPGNDQIYMGWETPEGHHAIQAAASAYRKVVSPGIKEEGTKGELRPEPRIDRWIFSTDGVGFPVKAEGSGIDVSDRKNWVRAGNFMHPPMFGVGPGIEQNTHKIGECVDQRELQHAIAVMAAFPSVFANED